MTHHKTAQTQKDPLRNDPKHSKKTTQSTKPPKAITQPKAQNIPQSETFYMIRTISVSQYLDVGKVTQKPIQKKTRKYSSV